MKYQMLKLKRTVKPKDKEHLISIHHFTLNKYRFEFISSGFENYIHCVDNEKWYILENEVRK